MNQIQKQLFNEIRQLDAVSFFNALIKEGYRLSLLSQSQLESLQYQLVQLLTDRFNLWTGGQSSSVPVEKGQQIQQSVFYTIGYYLKSLADVESAFEEVTNNKLQDLFHRGAKQIEKALKEAEVLLHAVRENRLDTDTLAYHESIDEGLPMFFAAYDMDYEAHETPASIDYPLGNDKMNLTGIEYIYVYLKKLKLENELCGYFHPDEIHGLLRGYDCQYKELLFSIYDLVLTNAVGCALLDREGFGLSISDYDRQYLQKELASLSQEKLSEMVDDAISRLCLTLPVTDPDLADYLMSSAVNLKSRLYTALEVNELKRLFLTTEEEAETPAIRFEDNAALDHDNFVKLADDIRECRFVIDKIRLLRRQPLGIKDLEDLLEGDCFFGEEFTEVLASLEDIQLVLLSKKLPLDPESLIFLEEESDREWQSSLNSYLTQMESGRKAAILALANRIES